MKVMAQADNQSYAVTPQLQTNQQHPSKTNEDPQQQQQQRPASLAWEDDDEVMKMLLQRNSLSLLLDNDTHLNFNEDGSFIGVYVGKQNSYAAEEGDRDSGIGGGGGGGESGYYNIRDGVIIDGNIYKNGVRLNRKKSQRGNEKTYQNVLESVSGINSASYNVRSSTAILGHKNGQKYMETFGKETGCGKIYDSSFNGDAMMPSKRKKRKPGEERKKFQAGVDYVREGNSSRVDSQRNEGVKGHGQTRRPENLYVVQPRMADMNLEREAEIKVPARASFGDDLIDSASFLEEIGEVLNMSLS